MGPRDLTVRGCRIKMLRGGKGAPVLLLHAAGGSRSLIGVAEALAEDYDVLLPDHPSFGESDECDWITSMSDLAYFYLDVIDDLKLSDVHVVGQSLGGWLACEMAVRSTARMKSLALTAPVGIYLRGVPYGDIFLWSPEQLARNVFASEAAVSAALAYQPSEREIEIIVRNRVAAARYAWSPRFHNPDLAKWLHRIDLPTLIQWGADDKVAPVAYAEEFARLIPRTELEIYPVCGHVPQVDARTAYLAKLRSFLRANAS